MIKINHKQIRESRAKALEKIKEYLESENIEIQFENLDTNFYGKERFLVSWISLYKSIPAEYSINLTDASYRFLSGYCCTYTTQGLFHQKQFEGYRSFERAFIEVGMKLCPNKEAKIEFFQKYAVPYNEKLKFRN